MWRWDVDKWQVGNERGVGGRVRNVVCEKGRWEGECRHVWRGRCVVRGEVVCLKR